MKFEVDVYVHTLSDDKLDELITLVKQVLKRETLIMATLEETLADVQAESAVDDSIITLVTGLKAQLDAVLGGQLTPAQQAQVDQIFAAIEANKAKVAAAVTANTPAAP